MGPVTGHVSFPPTNRSNNQLEETSDHLRSAAAEVRRDHFWLSFPSASLCRTISHHLNVIIQFYSKDIPLAENGEHALGGNAVTCNPSSSSATLMSGSVGTRSAYDLEALVPSHTRPRALYRHSQGIASTSTLPAEAPTGHLEQPLQAYDPAYLHPITDVSTVESVGTLVSTQPDASTDSAFNAGGHEEHASAMPQLASPHALRSPQHTQSRRMSGGGAMAQLTSPLTSLSSNGSSLLSPLNSSKSKSPSGIPQAASQGQLLAHQSPTISGMARRGSVVGVPPTTLDGFSEPSAAQAVNTSPANAVRRSASNNSTDSAMRSFTSAVATNKLARTWQKMPKVRAHPADCHCRTCAQHTRCTCMHVVFVTRYWKFLCLV